MVGGKSAIIMPLDILLKWLRIPHREELLSDPISYFRAFLATKRRRPFRFIDRYGHSYFLDPAVDQLFYLVYHKGHEDEAEFAYCRNFISKGMTVFDIGANMGLYSLILAKCTGETGSLHAFEPYDNIYKRLVNNLLDNGYHWAKANQLALSDKLGSLTLHIYETYTGWNTIGARKIILGGREIRPDRAENVATTTLDEYCAKHGVDKIDLAKIDVEGAEFLVLKGARGLLAKKKIGAILMEISTHTLGAAGSSCREVFEFMSGFGYRFHRIRSNGTAEETPVSEEEYSRVNLVALLAKA